MAVFWFLIALISIILYYVLLREKKNLPPGPKGLPIIGHLHLVGKNLHHDLRNLANKHGPIMYIRFGLAPYIIVSSPEAAELFLKTHDLVFAGRPPNQATDIMSWDRKGLAFAAYGPYWRSMRKLCTLEILTTQRINSFQRMRREELALFIESLKNDASNCFPVDLTAKVWSLTAEMSCMMVLGKKYEDEDMYEGGFKGAIRDGMRLGATPNFADLFPLLGKFDLQGLDKKMKVVAKVFNDFLEMVIDDHISMVDREEHTKGLIGTMISIMEDGDPEFQIDRRHIKSVMLDILSASMDTSAATVEWALSELIKNPKIMKKVQEELEKVVGLERRVEESDLDKLEYLNMVVKETFRLHPVAPLLLPHYSTEKCIVNGYDIPKASRVFVNIYAIGRDPDLWSGSEKFIPERFNGSDLDVWGQHFQLLPFGSGRRGCPGMQLGLIQVRLVIAQLVHCFDWKLPDEMKPDDLDMTEQFSIVVARAKPLILVPSYRLHC